MFATQTRLLEQSAALSDEEIVARVAAGDLPMYEVLMRRHNQLVYRAVRAILRNESEVEDVLQETYLAAYSHLGDFAGRARFSTWLVRIAVNKAVDRLRLTSRESDLDPASEEEFVARISALAPQQEAVDPEQQSVSRELTLLLTGAIDALPPTYRTIYMLREVEGLSTQEAADALDLEPATVKTRLHRARGLLRERLYRDAGASASETFTFGAQRCDRVVAAVLARIQRKQ